MDQFLICTGGVEMKKIWFVLMIVLVAVMAMVGVVSAQSCEGQCWQFNPSSQSMTWVGPIDGVEDIFQGDPVSLHRARSGWVVKWETSVPGSIEVCLGVIKLDGKEIFNQSNCSGKEISVGAGKFEYFIPSSMRTEIDSQGTRFAPTGGFRWKPQSGCGYLAASQPTTEPTAAQQPTPTRVPTATPTSTQEAVAAAPATTPTPTNEQATSSTPGFSWWWAVIPLALLALLGGVIWLFLRRRRSSEASEETPAEEPESSPADLEPEPEPETPEESEAGEESDD